MSMQTSIRVPSWNLRPKAGLLINKFCWVSTFDIFTPQTMMNDFSHNRSVLVCSTSYLDIQKWLDKVKVLDPFNSWVKDSTLMGYCT